MAAAVLRTWKREISKRVSLALKLGGDGPNTPFNSDHAHGPAEERVLMFERGFRGGLPACSETMATKLSANRAHNSLGYPGQ